MRAFPDLAVLVETPVDIIAKSTGLNEQTATEVRAYIRDRLYGA